MQCPISFNDRTSDMSKPKILMVLNLLCRKILCIYLCLSISVSKSCQIVINICFCLLAYSVVLPLNCKFFDNLNLPVFLPKCALTEKSAIPFEIGTHLKKTFRIFLRKKKRMITMFSDNRI